MAFLLLVAREDSVDRRGRAPGTIAGSRTLWSCLLSFLLPSLLPSLSLSCLSLSVCLSVSLSVCLHVEPRSQPLVPSSIVLNLVILLGSLSLTFLALVSLARLAVQ